MSPTLALASPAPLRLPPLIVGCLAATWLIWGSTYLAIKWALVSLPPFFQMGTRFVAAGLLLAASLGFGVGAGAIYLLSTRWVFRRRKLAGKTPVEFSAFVAIGLAGLALNDFVIYLAVDGLGLALLAAKAVAAGASFLFNYTARKLALF